MWCWRGSISSGWLGYGVDGIDLPEIIRRSTGSMASDVVRGVRLQTKEADQALSRLVDRLLLLRTRSAPPVAPAASLDGSDV